MCDNSPILVTFHPHDPPGSHIYSYTPPLVCTLAPNACFKLNSTSPTVYQCVSLSCPPESDVEEEVRQEHQPHAFVTHREWCILSTWHVRSRFYFLSGTRLFKVDFRGNKLFLLLLPHTTMTTQLSSGTQE